MMKKFIVSEACNGCGECMIRTHLLTENEKGFAIPVVGLYIREDKLAEAEQTAAMCPVQALSIVDVGTSRDIQTLPKELNNRLSAVEIPDVSREDLKFKDKEYSLHIGHDADDDCAEFSSRNRAKSEGESRFYEIFWNHRQDYVLDVLSQYKSKKLRQFFDFKNRKKSYYVKVSQQMEMILSEISMQAAALTEDEITLPKNFITFCPEKDKDFQKKAAEQLDKYFDTTDYVRDYLEELEKEKSYRRRDYEEHIYAQERVEIVGKDWLGNNKIKTVYRYKNVNELGKELARDVSRNLAMPGRLRAIDDIAETEVNYILGLYRELVEKEIQKKVKMLEAAIKEM